MSKFLEFLKGKKTYITGGVALLLAGLLQFDVIDKHTYDNLEAILLGLGFITLRAAVSKNGAQIESKKNLV